MFIVERETMGEGDRKKIKLGKESLMTRRDRNMDDNHMMILLGEQNNPSPVLTKTHLVI